MRRTAGGLVDNEYRVLAALLRASGGVSIGEILVLLAELDPKGRLMNEATVYRITRRLMDREWVACTWRADDIDARPKREFRLTSSGLSEAQDLLAKYAASGAVTWC